MTKTSPPPRDDPRRPVPIAAIPEELMLTCVPRSIISWDFHVQGTSAGSASLSFNLFTEQGSISIGSAKYAVRKHGFLGGRWTLERGGKVIAEACKPSSLFRSFQLNADGHHLSLEGQLFSRSFEVKRGRDIAGSIRPLHPFTRRARVICRSDIPEPVQLFAFWLAALTWKRAARSSAASG